ALPKVGKYTVDVAAFEAFALPALEPPKEEFQLPENPRLYEDEGASQKVVSLLYEPTEDEEGANSRIRLEFGEELNVPPSTLQEIPAGWKHPDQEDEPVPRLCVVDEVGKMGLMSVQFPKTLSKVLDAEVVLATGVQTAKGQRDPEAIEDIKKRPGVRVVKLTRNNRDALVDQTYAQLRESLSLGPPGTGKPRVRTKKKKEEERKARERAEREAREQEEREREEAAEQEKVARRERQMAKEKARAERLAKERAEREVEAAKARAERKRRAEARKKALEDAKNGIVVEQEDVDDVDDVEDFGGTSSTTSPMPVVHAASSRLKPQHGRCRFYTRRKAVAPSLDLVDDAIDVLEEAPRKRRKTKAVLQASPDSAVSASPASPSPQGPDPPSPDGVSRVVPVVPVLGTAVPAKVQLVGWRIGIESCPWFLARCLE
ncbi:unnamed protein product, partial [Durusdinium trenchii]